MTDTQHHDLSIWEGDGLPDYEAWTDLVNTLDMTAPEQEAWRDACKREAWVHERTAKHETEHRDWHLAVARYFWRRAQTLSEYTKRLTAELDAEDPA